MPYYIQTEDSEYLLQEDGGKFLLSPNTFTEDFSESSVVSSSLIRNISKNLSSSITAVSSIITGFIFQKQFLDSLSATDVDTTNFNGGGFGAKYFGGMYLGGAMGEASNTNLFSIMVGKVFINTVTVASVLSRILQAFRTFSDLIVTAEIFSVLRTRAKSVLDSVSVSSILARVISFVRILSDSLVAASSMSQFILRTVSKTLTLIYNIFEFVLGHRSKTAFMRQEIEHPEVFGTVIDTPDTMSAGAQNPEILGTGGEAPLTLSVNGDKPTIMSAKTE